MQIKHLLVRLVVLMMLIIIPSISATDYCTAAQGAISLWQFEEESGTAIADYFGNHNGTAVSILDANMNQSCKVNECINWVDTDADYITVPAITEIMGNPGFTACYWMKPRVLTEDNTAFATSTSGTNDIMMWMDTDYSGVADMYGFLSDTGTSTRTNTPANTAALKWQFVCGTQNGTTGKGYIGGIHTVGAISSTGSVTPTSATATHIGRWGNSATFDMDGYLDELIMFNRTLSDSEILELYDQTRYGVNDYCDTTGIIFCGGSDYVFCTDFESDDGYVSGARTYGQPGQATGINWTGDNISQSIIFNESNGNYVMQNSDTTTTTNSHLKPTVDSDFEIMFDIKFNGLNTGIPYVVTTKDGANFGVTLRCQTNGDLTADSPSPTVIKVDGCLVQDWVTIQLDIHDDTDTWDVWYDGVEIATGLGDYSDGYTDFDTLEFRASSALATNVVSYDNLCIANDVSANCFAVVSTPATVTLTEPADAAEIGYGANTTFGYTLAGFDNSTNISCDLNIGGVKDQGEIITPTWTANQSFSKTLTAAGNASWNVNCSQASGLNATSGNNTYSVVGALGIYDLTHESLLKEHHQNNVSVPVDGYSATMLFIDEFSHFAMDSLTSSTLSTSTTPTFESQNRTDGTNDGNTAISNTAWVRTGYYDPYYELNGQTTSDYRFMVYYGQLNVTSVDCVDDYELCVLADQNPTEIAAQSRDGDINLFGYIAVSDYNGSNASWVGGKINESKDWMDINASMGVFIDGFDIGIINDDGNFSMKVKEIIDYIKIDRQRECVANAYTQYSEFADWCNYAMKESCVYRWDYTNGVNSSDGYNYSQEDWALELTKAEWYKNHNVPVLCVMFDNSSSKIDIEDHAYGARVLGYDYVYRSTPDFQTIYEDKWYPAGDLLQKKWELDAEDGEYRRRWSNGVIRYNNGTEHGSFDNGWRVLDSTIGVHLYDSAGIYYVKINNQTPAHNYTGGSTFAPIWVDFNLTEAEFATHDSGGYYDVEIYSTAAGGNVYWDELAGTGTHSQYSSDSGDTWSDLFAGLDRNYMVRIDVNESIVKAVDSGISTITQNNSDDTDNGIVLINMSSTVIQDLEVWTYGYERADFLNMTYYNGTDDFNLNYTNTTSCNSVAPDWATNTVAGLEVKACLEPSGNDTYFRFTVPSLSDKLLHILYTAIGGDSCVYTSGNYEVNCTESCNVTNTDYDILGNNITIIGNGTITYTNSTISNWLNMLIQGLDSTNRCTVITQQGGGFQNG